VTQGAAHLVFYSDVAYFGGHEKMTVEIIRNLAAHSGVRITAVVHEGNARLIEGLRAAGGNVALKTIPYVSKATGWLRLPFEMPQAWKISRLLKSLAPTYFIIFAGNIDTCLKGIYAAKLAGFPIVMYLPQAHKASFLGSKLGKKRDVIQDFFYRKVDFWITISHGMAGVLAGHGIAPASIRAVYNGIDTAPLHRHDKAAARARLGLPEGPYLIANVGRIDFYVKNQELLLDALRRHRERFRGCLVAFVGDGPDEAGLAQSIREAGLQDVARIVPWQTDVSFIYSALDMLLITSKIEGMPLVMMEAMHYGLPIVSSDVDGMKEILPPAWLFRSGDADGLAARVEEVRAADTEALRRGHQALLAEKFNLERMGAAFLDALKDAPACR
jgi:glycosyltransferase involved in cell wall biosynthesis